MKKSVFFLTLLFTLTTNSYAAKSWEFHSEGDGTSFESRWATTEPLEDKSSADTTSAIAQINANQQQLSLYIEDPRPSVESLQSLLTGEDLKCTYDNWQLAIDRIRFPIKRTSKSSDNKATLLQAADLRAFWEAFAAGSLMAVRLDRTCNDNMNKITIVYSLSGSKAAIDYVQFKDPVIKEKKLEPKGKIEDERKRKEEDEKNRSEAGEALQKQIEAEKQASQGQPDLSNLDSETRRSIEATCSGKFYSGPVAHRSCLNEQLKSIEGIGQAPDLSNLDSETRRSIEATCSGKFYSGPVAHRSCLNEQLKSIEGIGQAPDLSNLDSETRRSIEATCSGKFYSGPVAHRSCLNEQLKSIEGIGQAPDLSNLDSETRRSIEATCSGKFYSGPAVHRKCLEKQLKSIGM